MAKDGYKEESRQFQVQKAWTKHDEVVSGKGGKVSSVGADAEREEFVSVKLWRSSHEEQAKLEANADENKEEEGEEEEDENGEKKSSGGGDKGMMTKAISSFAEEFYSKQGKELPSAKGISLTAEQWATFKKNILAVENAIKKMESRS
ncbi:hypothetical protein HAX54_008941 [Datura stramonium]|uniref:Transcriptional coactivator p15 (PC4) C-terminal domain-containing protein n=1 Tax=Datura stramonium TaxID=4076 RepID=A0ABS8RXJ6_DATST|nr:hypothetical protein [Datura stramonium]